MCEDPDTTSYGVATIRLLKIIGLFCKKSLLKSLYSAKETYNFKEPTNCSHPIALLITLAPTNILLYYLACLLHVYSMFTHGYKSIGFFKGASSLDVRGCQHDTFFYSKCKYYECGKMPMRRVFFSI